MIPQLRVPHLRGQFLKERLAGVVVDGILLYRPSSVTDAEWAVLEPFLPSAQRSPRAPRTRSSSLCLLNPVATASLASFAGRGRRARAGAVTA